LEKPVEYYDHLPLKELLRLAECKENPLARAILNKLWEVDLEIKDSILESQGDIDVDGAVQEAYEKIELGLSHLPRDALFPHVEEALDELQEKLEKKLEERAEVSLIEIIYTSMG
jgi:hypothetical protein